MQSMKMRSDEVVGGGGENLSLNMDYALFFLQGNWQSTSTSILVKGWS